MRASREESGLRRRVSAGAASGLVVAGLALAGLHLDARANDPVKPVEAAQPAAAPVAKEPSAVKPAPAPAKPAVAAPSPSVARPVAPSVPAAKPAAPVPSKAQPASKGTPLPNDKLGPSPQVAKAPGKVAAVPAGAKNTVTPVASGSAVPKAQAPAGPPKSALIQSSAILDQHVTYQYNALGRRDPFQPILGGEFIGDDIGGDAPVDVGGIQVVGIMWGTNDKFALVEDGRGNSLVLRTGDKVMNGVVEELKRESVVVKLTVDGQTQSVAIPLTRKGETNASR